MVGKVDLSGMSNSTSLTNTKQYNSCLGFLMGLACIFVVFMHCEFPGKIGVIVQAISRFSIPFFSLSFQSFFYPETRNMKGGGG